MRTILYQPVYINPQAYFVFPSLYHIEKGDSYVEPAVYTGQLLIDVVDGSASSVIIKDTKQVDFSDYAGKHIRISQYTDEGAVVLGEWLIPGVPIPQWFKDSIVCWYSPRKQGLTEYDVIESYAEDFSKFPWNNKTEKYTGTLTPNTLTITNVAFKSSLIYTNSKPENFKVYITGLTYDQQIIFGDDTSPYRALIVEKDGIYDVSWEGIHKSYGIFCNFVGECNIKITQLPTSILKDYSGNNLDAYLYGFKGKLNSGIGLYLYDFTSDLRINSAYIPYTDIYANSICSLSGHVAGWLFQFKDANINIAPLKIKVKGIVNDVFEYWGYDENGIRFYFKINKDGVYELPASYVVETNHGVGIKCLTDCVDNVCFTQIPDYPNQLCYNGRSYGVAYGLPILSDYTIIADRTWFKDKVTSWSYFIDKKRAFDFEKTQLGINYSVSSYAASTTIDLQDSGISYQTKTSYNGQHIDYHSNQADNSNTMYIGTTREDIGKQGIIGCHGDILLFNRTLTDDEITWLKETIFNNN